MADYGIVPEGFRRKTVDNIIDELRADQLSTMYEDLDVSDESVVGQQNAIFANQLGEGWEQLEQLYNAGDADVAEDRLLENLCKLTGVLREGSTKGHVTLACNVDVGTTLVAGVHFAALKDQPDIRWTPVESFTSPSTGSHDVVFEAENPGPILAVAGSITVIATPIVGWNSVNQPSDADPGDYAMSDSALKQRRGRELATMGSATLPAVKAALSEKFGDLISLAVYENDTDYVDDAGRPPHAVEPLLFDGEPPAADDDLIAQTIYEAVSGGIPTYGNNSGTAQALDGTEIVPKTIYFSRPVVKDVYLEFDVTKGAGYPGDDALKLYIATQANALHLPGISVAWSLLSSLSFGLGGVAKCTQVRLGFSPSPTAHEVDLSIALREIARFSTDRIVINAT